jgi:hypothetical protein
MAINGNEWGSIYRGKRVFTECRLLNGVQEVASSNLAGPILIEVSLAKDSRAMPEK